MSCARAALATLGSPALRALQTALDGVIARADAELAALQAAALRVELLPAQLLDFAEQTAVDLAQAPVEALSDILPQDEACKELGAPIRDARAILRQADERALDTERLAVEEEAARARVVQSTLRSTRQELEQARDDLRRFRETVEEAIRTSPSNQSPRRGTTGVLEYS